MGSLEVYISLLSIFLFSSTFGSNLNVVKQIKPLDDVQAILDAINENSCLENNCKAFEDDIAHENFVNIFSDLDEVLQDLSPETIRERTESKDDNSTNRLFQFLRSDPNEDDIKAFVDERHKHLKRSLALTGHKIIKRSIGQTIRTTIDWVLEKIKHVDWWSVAKRAGQALGVIQSVRSLTDPSQIAINAGFAVGKALVAEAVEKTLDDAWEG